MMNYLDKLEEVNYLMGLRDEIEDRDFRDERIEEIDEEIDRLRREMDIDY